MQNPLIWRVLATGAEPIELGEGWRRNDCLSIEVPRMLALVRAALEDVRVELQRPCGQLRPIDLIPILYLVDFRRWGKALLELLFDPRDKTLINTVSVAVSTVRSFATVGYHGAPFSLFIMNTFSQHRLFTNYRVDARIANSNLVNINNRVRQ